jgi:hypothetical protein
MQASLNPYAFAPTLGHRRNERLEELLASVDHVACGGVEAASSAHTAKRMTAQGGKMKGITIFGCFVAAVTFSACGDTESPGGPDFERELGPGEYQVSVTGDVQRSFETTGATFLEPQFPVGFEQGTLALYGVGDDYPDAQFELCPTAQQRAYVFDAMLQEARCPSDPRRANGGFMIESRVPQAGVLDCYPNGYGDKDFEGVLTITSVTDSDIRGEAQGDGTCSIHPHEDFESRQTAAVSIRMRFRAVRETP